MTQKATTENGQVVTIQTAGPGEILKSDWLKGLIVALISAIIGAVLALIESGTMFGPGSWKAIGSAALVGFLGYIGKNLSTTTTRVLTPEGATPTFR